jgi:hypothetical protein
VPQLRLRRGFRVQLAEDAGDVRLDGALGDVQVAGNLLIGRILCQKAQDLLFALEQRPGVDSGRFLQLGYNFRLRPMAGATPSGQRRGWGHTALRARYL